MVVFKKLDIWLDQNTFNGFNHGLYSVVIILLFGLLGYNYSIGAYIGCIIVFYLGEVKQAVDTQFWSRSKAYKFWLWQWSKIQDVLTVLVMGGIAVAGVVYAYISH